MRRLCLLVVGFAVTSLPVLPTVAATFGNLYQVTVSPAPNVPDQRAEATRIAMARLLIRVTGKREASFDPQLQPLIADPSAYLNSYGRDRQGQPVVSFNARLIDQALTTLNWPVWGPERPLTLLWIAVDNGQGERALLSANEIGPEVSPEMAALLTDIQTQIAAVADERGLPVAYPLLDLEDITAVAFTDVWGGFDEPIALASARYRPDAVLIGRIRPSDFGNEVQWLMIKDGERRGLAGISVQDGLDAVANLYASEFGVVGGTTPTQITVTDVATPADYGRVMSYLEGLSVLQTVDVEGLDRGVLNLRVAARGDARVLERVLALGGVLMPAAAPAGAVQPASAAALVFRVARPGSAR